MSAPDRWSDMPISAPIYVWLVYSALVITFCFLAHDFWPIVTAAFSFQFWTFAIYRGLRRARGGQVTRRVP